MRKLFHFILLVTPTLLFAPGCDSQSAGNVVTNADQSAIDEYRALIEADEAAMQAAPPVDVR